MKFALFLRDVFDAINTPGGHVCICLSLLIIYARTTTTGLEHDVAVFAMGVLSRSMGTATTPAASSITSRTVTTVTPTETNTAVAKSETVDDPADPADRV